MTHFATPGFWFHYRSLPETVQRQADLRFQLLRNDPSHPSLRLKKVGEFYSVRVSLNIRALAKARAGGLVWFWIGNHDSYEKLIDG